MPTVSVIIPAHNNAESLPEAIQSVAAQTWRDLETIVVDDASSDATPAVARDAVSRLSNARVVRLPGNRGPAGARNRGMAEAGGDWVAFLDADDAWFPWRLKDQLHALAWFPDAVLFCGRLAAFEARDAVRVPPERARCRSIRLGDFVDENPVPTSSVLARRDAIERAGGFDERFRGPEDIDLWMRLAPLGELVNLNVPLGRYREKAGSLSMDPDRFLPQILAVYEKAFAPDGVLASRRRLRRRAMAGRYVSCAWTHLACNARGKGLQRLLRSWLIWPGRIKVEEARPTWRFRMLARLLLPWAGRERGASKDDHDS